jgi:ActR/RegA family two-component response regulator
MLGTALLCDKDKLLLDTRARLLKSVGIESTITISVAEIELTLSETRFGLVVLGALLTDDEVNKVVSIIRIRWPEAKILIFYRLDLIREEISGCSYMEAPGPPRDFIAKAIEMLESTR